jgi:glycosyltransferase involved in cell wall biosynthesis
MKILLVHPGTQHSYKLARELHLQNKLFKFCTRFSVSQKGLLHKLLPTKVTSRIQNRIIDLPADKLYTIPWIELYYQYFVKSDKPWYRLQYEMSELFQNSIPDKLIKECDIVIGYDTSSKILVEKAKKYNKIFILDRTIGHPASQSEIFTTLSKLYPLWNVNMPIKEQSYIDYEQYEHDGSDLIVVPSQFVKKTLTENNTPESKIAINPFGTNLDFFNNVHRNKKELDEISFLFFGTVSARKGVPTLFEAWNKINPKNAKLILAGFGQIPEGVSLPNNVSFIGVIPADERDQLFSNADVFVFPSFFEGFAQVQIEAAASGLPIITTPNAGGDEIVNDFENGILIEPGNVGSLSDAINYFIDNPDMIEKMGELSKQRAKEKFSWSHYGERWAKILDDL